MPETTLIRPTPARRMKKPLRRKGLGEVTQLAARQCQKRLKSRDWRIGDLNP